ncbi:MAG: MraY family glycosyltransferase [Bacteroidota bacterium]
MNQDIVQILVYSFLTAFGITFLAIPTIIRVAEAKNLYDEPSIRKSHSKKIPTLGGIGIFGGVMFAITFWTNFTECAHLQYIIAAMTVISFIGIKDDLTGLSAFKKFVGQIVAATILVVWGNIRITYMFGIFGIGELHPIISIIFSILVILVIINSFNMIDGINGLSASFGIISSATFATWFVLAGDYQHAIMAVALIGSLLAFLRFNVTPAKIFMGDTGSMLLGLILSVFALEFIQINGHFIHPYAIKSAPVIAIATLFIPLFDLFRVFAIRILRGRSPFKPDRNHLHHILLYLGFSHNFSTFILSIFAILLIVIAFILQNIGTYSLGFLLLIITTIFAVLISYLAKRKRLKESIK